MTKAEIVQVIYGRLGGFSKKEAADLVDLVFEAMKETLARGEKIKVSGFGNFVLRDKRQRQGRNPQTGEPIVITQRRVLSFKASQILKQGLNPKKGGPADGVHASGATPPARAEGFAPAGNSQLSKALPSNALQAKALPSNALQAKALQGNALQGNALQGNALQSNAAQSSATGSTQASANPAPLGAAPGRVVTLED